MIPVNKPFIGKNELKYLNECVKSGWISSEGPYVEKFEKAFAENIGSSHAIAVCNGTAAIEVALYASGVKKGDEVILPSFTIISCVLAVIRLNAVPVLVDIDPDTWNMSVEAVREKITNKTKVIMAVHIYGHPVDMDPLLEVAKKNKIIVLEDTSQALGAMYKGKKCGSIGDISSFSFYANKFVTTGEGGMVVTNSHDMDIRARSYRNLCFNNKERFLHDDIGYNFRMTAMQAAIGLGQIERLEKVVKRKIRMGHLYAKQLSKINGIKLQIEKPWAKTVYWMYCIQLDPSLGTNAKEMMAALASMGIGTRPFFRGLHDQPSLKKLILNSNEKFPITDLSYKYGLYLPSSYKLTNSEINLVCDKVRKSLHMLKKV